MPLNLYKQLHNEVLSSSEIEINIDRSVELLKNTNRIYFIGNGGSNAICSHMMEDFGKMGRFKTHSFSDAALITCYANDYGYENAMSEWLKLHIEPNDLLVAISSSGNSMNIINAVNTAKGKGAKVLALSGFKQDNKLNALGDISFHVGAENYGVVECLHQTLLHIILDKYAQK